MQGGPLRVEIGPKDMEQNQCVIVRRDNGEKIVTPLDNLEQAVEQELENLRTALFEKAMANLNSRTHTAENMEEIKAHVAQGNCFIRAKWCGDEACEDKVKEETGVGSRCIPLMQTMDMGRCVCCGKPAGQTVVWPKAY